MRGRILIVDKKVLTPDRDSGSASTFSYLQILSRAGYEIVFVPDTPTERDGYSRALDALGIKTLLAPEWTSTLAGVEAFAPRCDLILLYRAPVAAKVFEVARSAAPPGVKILFHAVDLHFLRLLRQAEASGRRTDLDVAMMTREIELNLVNTCDATIVVSAFEQDLLRELVPSASVHHIPILRDIPQRGWAELFEHSARRVPCRQGGLGRWLRQHDPLWRKRRDVVFLGGYEHAPNCDAIHWFVGSVWPLLQSRGFPHRLVIAGSNVPPDIVALASDKIEVRGYIHDLKALFAGCRLSIAPLRYGAGLRARS